MMAATQRGAHPFAPLVLDDAGSLEAIAAAVMRPTQHADDGRALLFDRRHRWPGRA